MPLLGSLAASVPTADACQLVSASHSLLVVYFRGHCTRGGVKAGEEARRITVAEAPAAEGKRRRLRLPD